MASLKAIILKLNTKQTGECNVYIQIIHKRKVERIKTDIFVLADHFENGKVISGRFGDKNAALKNFRIGEKLTEYEGKLLKIEDIETLSVKEIKNHLLSIEKVATTNFCEYTEKRIAELTADKKLGTVKPLKNTLDRVIEFNGSRKLDFSEITPIYLSRFVSYYKTGTKGKKERTGKSPASIAIYLRYIRSMFNDAMDEYNDGAEPVIKNYPFRKFKIETTKSMNRNLDVDVVKKIRDYHPKTKREEFSKDIFILDMMLLGINMKDLFYLKHEDVVKGRLQYNRFKTDRFFSIKLEPEAINLLEKYKGEKHLLWFADNSEKKSIAPHHRSSEYQYKDHTAFTRMINENLQRIQKEIDLTGFDLTTYYARHSVATLMREIGISKDDISLCLGHTDPDRNLKVTGGYIKEDFIKVDQANRKLIDYLIE